MLNDVYMRYFLNKSRGWKEICMYFKFDVKELDKDSFFGVLKNLLLELFLFCIFLYCRSKWILIIEL